MEIDPEELFFVAKRAELYFQLDEFDNALKDFNAAIAKQVKLFVN